MNNSVYSVLILLLEVIIFTSALNDETLNVMNIPLRKYPSLELPSAFN